MSLDPAALQVLISRLTGVAEEMGAVLRRAAFSPNIKERADCSAALFTPEGELLVQAEHIPVHLGSMPAGVRAAIDAFGDSPAPGDQVVLNDPFAGGTHLNDITLVAPCIVGGRLVGWAANRAHHADVGGAAPGSLPADATEIYEEGLRIPPTRLDDGVRALLLANSRTPEERVGDLDAQVGANVVGVARLATMRDEPFGAVVAYGERRMRAALAGLPDGRWRATDVLDSTGAGPGQREPATVRVAVEVAGDSMTVDFTGTDAQSRGNVNAVEAVTVSAVAYAVRSAVDPTIPANGGALRPVRVVAPPGTLVAAQPPAAVGAGNVEVSQRVADACLAALAEPCAALAPAAGQGTMNNLLVGGSGWVYYETVAGGQGGRPAPGATGHDAEQVLGSNPGLPGQSGIQVGMTNTKNTPIEALERAYPMRVLRYRLRRGSGGAGRAPGGEGIERDLQVLEECTVSLITERRSSRPPGLWGGEPGATGENWLLPGGDESRAERLPDKCTIRLAAGDVVRMLTPGGGGWGPPPPSVTVRGGRPRGSAAMGTEAPGGERVPSGEGERAPSPFEPWMLGPLRLRNRFVKAATFEGVMPRGAVTDDLVAFHVRVAKGGAALTTLAYCAVSPGGRVHRHTLVMADEIVGDLRRLTEAVHAEGAVIAAQVGHAGPVANVRSNRCPTLAPSGRFSAPAMGWVRAATPARLDEVVEDFARAARVADAAGFDAVEVHVGHNYLLSSFLSPNLNRRRDDYGGSVENRARLARRAIEAVRRAAGPHMAVTAKLNMADGVPGGLWLEESLEVAALLEGDGHLDAIQLTGGSSLLNGMYYFRGEVPLAEMAAAQSRLVGLGLRAYGRRIFPSYPFEEAFFLPFARQFRAALSMPLILLGGINRLDTIEAALAEGFDAVAMARALLREPDLVESFRRHRRPEGLCVHCNKCMPTIYSGTRCVLVPKAQAGGAAVRSGG